MPFIKNFLTSPIHVDGNHTEMVVYCISYVKKLEQVQAKGLILPAVVPTARTLSARCRSALEVIGGVSEEHDKCFL